MADETTEFQLSCVLCEAKDFNTGRCRIAPSLIEKIGGRINSPVRLSVDSGFVFWSLWPRTDANDSVVQYDADMIRLSPFGTARIYARSTILVT